MVAAATPTGLSCDHQLLANGHHSFLLRGISSFPPDCTSSSWEDQSGKVLARGAGFDRDQVVSVTNVSITNRQCVNLTIYKNECQNLLMVQCNASCSLQTAINQTVDVSRTCFSEGFCVETWAFGLATAAVLAAALLLAFVVLRLQRRSQARKDRQALRDVELQEVDVKVEPRKSQLLAPAGVY